MMSVVTNADTRMKLKTIKQESNNTDNSSTSFDFCHTASLNAGHRSREKIGKDEVKRIAEVVHIVHNC